MHLNPLTHSPEGFNPGGGGGGGTPLSDRGVPRTFSNPDPIKG